MRQWNLRELLAGIFLFGVGGFLTVHLSMTLGMGTARNLGPGLFPTVVAVGLALTGIISIANGLRSRSEAVEGIDWIALLFVTASILAFVVLLPMFGLLVAIGFQLVISCIFDTRFTLKERLIYTPAMMIAAYLIFVLGLRIQVPVFAWPW